MRDILISLAIFGALPFVFRIPKLGVYLWTWVSMMVPHRLTYGFAHRLPFAQAIAVVTLISLLFTKQRKPFPLNSVTVTLLALFGWMCVTSLFALNTFDLVLERLVLFTKILVMLFATLMLLRGRHDIERLIWVVTLSIGFYGFKGGLWTVLTGGASRVWGPPGGFLEDNNSLAVGLVMILPFLYYFFNTSKRRLIRWLLGLGLTLVAFSVLGSQSRGALLAVVAMATMLGLKSRHKVRAISAILLIGSMAIAFMPDSWNKRMESVQNYQEDGSAMSRLYTWQTLFNVAIDRPLVGAGFRADSPEVFARYAPSAGKFLTDDGTVFVAHSIYFQALGEHGFPGLLLFILVGWTAWRKATQLAAQARHDPEFAEWVPALMSMVQVSLIGFAVGGAFLSLMLCDLPYYVVSYVVLVDATMRGRLLQRAEAASAPAGRPDAPRALSYSKSPVSSS